MSQLLSKSKLIYDYIKTKRYVETYMELAP
jgi:hypothetical protein